MCLFGGNSNQALADQQTQQAAEARADADKKSADIATGQNNINAAFSGFDDNYFSKLSQNYRDYAQPQLNDQYDYAKKNVTYALARNGTTNSSIAGDEFGQLAKQYATNQNQISGVADNYATQAQKDIAANKSDITSQLFSTADASAANTAALSAAKAIAAPPVFSPLGNLFTNVSAVAAQNKLASDANAYSPAAGARLFQTNTSPSYSVA